MPRNLHLKVPTQTLRKYPMREGDPDRPRCRYLRLRLRNKLVKLGLHEWPVCGTRAAGQERSVLQQVLRSLWWRCGAHPSLHDNTELAQSAPQQGLQTKQRGSKGGVLSWVACERPSCCLSCRPTEDTGLLQTQRLTLGDCGVEPHWRDWEILLTASKALFLPSSHWLLKVIWDMDIFICTLQMSKLKLKGLAPSHACRS